LLFFFVLHHRHAALSFLLWFFFNLVEKQRLQKKFSFKQFQTVPAIHVPFNLSTK